MFTSASVGHTYIPARGEEGEGGGSEWWREGEGKRGRKRQGSKDHVVRCCDDAMYSTCLMRDEEGMKKEASKVKQTRQSNTAHPRQSLFLRKMSCLR